MKKIFALLCCFVMLFSIVSCGDSKEKLVTAPWRVRWQEIDIYPRGARNRLWEESCMWILRCCQKSMYLKN